MTKFFHAAVALTVLALLPAAAATRPTVGLLLKVRSTEGFWAGVEKGAKEAAEVAGVDLIVKGTTDPGNSFAQIKLLESLVGQKIDALIVSPSNPERLIAPLGIQAAKGLKIVIAESELSANAPFPFVGYDQDKLSAAAATAFAAFLKEDDAAALFQGSVVDPVMLQRDRVVLTKLKELRPHLKLYLDFFAIADESSSPSQKATLLLQKHPDCKLYISTSSAATGALLDAAKSQSGAGPSKLAGFGLDLSPAIVEAIENGTMQAYLTQVPREIGYKSVLVAAALIRGESVSPKTDIPFFVVTKENLNSAAIQALRTGK